MQIEMNQMEDQIEDQKMKISELEKQKAVMAKCVKNETAYYDISKIVDERSKKEATEYEVQWANSWMNEDKIPDIILKQWNRKKVKRESFASFQSDLNDDDGGKRDMKTTSVISLNSL